jgi:RNA polymerase sigma-70 factor (ECF subfamily)
MGEVAGLRRTWNAPDELMVKPVTFEEFFEEHKERLLRILSVITGSRAEAEDLVQEAFTRVFERWDTVAAMEDPAGYLHRTAMNLFRNQYRRARVTLGRTVGLGPEQDVFKPVEDRDFVARALGKLTPRQRAALVLTESLGYSGDEAGRLLGIKASTVWALTHQARSALRGTVEATDA